MADSKTKTVQAKCFCASIHFTIDVPISSLPLTVHLCHCSICRFGTGAPCIFHAVLPKGLKPNFIAPSTEQNLTTYSIKGASCTYDFCSTYGCHIAAVGLDREEWVVSPSIIADHAEMFQIDHHIYSKSVKGGGIAQFLTYMGSRQLGDWNPPDDDAHAKVVEAKAEVGEDGQERLRAQCHCGGVSFTIKRPTEKLLEDEFISSFISPVDKTKWLAILDACDHCRLVDGTHVVGWALLPLSFCEPKIKSDLKIGTAKTFASSPDVLRSFCGACGATIFFSHVKRTPSEERQVVDLATGILRAPEGAMAENWLTWKSQLVWADSGKRFDKEFNEALEEGMKQSALTMKT